MRDTRAELSTAIRRALAALGADDGVEVVIEPSARAEFGDWSTPAPLRAAKVLRRSPLQIAEDLRQQLASMDIPLVAEWTVTPPGYVNARLDDALWAGAVLEGAADLATMTAIPMPGGYPPVDERTLVEHTATNPNKAAHVGHLRNACLGDAVARILRRVGTELEINNYIDDTGVQVADVTVGIRDLGLEQKPGEPFDQYCSRVYVEVSRRYESDPGLQQRRREVLHEIEAGIDPTAAFVKDLTHRVVEAHLRTMRRFDISYDLLTWESDIIHLGFWRQAFELVREAGAIVLVTEGKNSGCWVMPDDSHAVNSDEAKVLVKSDGVATYTAKDIAYQLWKFGLLGRDFGYWPWDENDPHAPFTTTDNPGEGPQGRFGSAKRVINVIDIRQSYPQEIVRRAVERLGHREAAERSVHLAYEVVALSADAARELGIDVGAEKEVYAFSGRQGIEVRADDLLDRAISKVTDKGSPLAAASLVAAGAVRYYLQKFSLTQIIAFDFEDALRTTGDTGVYLQYAHARAAGILRKVTDDGQPLVVPPLAPVERALLHRVDGYQYALADAAAQLSPSVLCAYAFSLASALSEFYEHTPPIIREEDAAVRRFRLRLVAAARTTLGDALSTLGMGAPDRI